MAQALFHGDERVTRFPHKLPNGLLVLRFERPSFSWPSGKVVVNSNRRENYVAAPPAVGLQVRDA